MSSSQTLGPLGPPDFQLRIFQVLFPIPLPTRSRPRGRTVHRVRSTDARGKNTSGTADTDDDIRIISNDSQHLLRQSTGLQNVTDMAYIYLCKNIGRFWLEVWETTQYFQIKQFQGKSVNCDEGLSLTTFIFSLFPPEVANYLNFVKFEYQICRNLRGVKLDL